MSKYEPLGDYLLSQKHDKVPMTFAQIERLTGESLPSSHQYRAWWSNNPTNNVMTKVWLDAGFISEKVDMSARKLVFRRVRAATSSSKSRRTAVPPGGAVATGRHPLWGALKGLMRIQRDTDLTQPADPEWGTDE